MKVLKNEKLDKYTTIKIGGYAKKMYFPDNISDLKKILKSEKQYKIISGGSNLLINDTVTFPCVISMINCCDEINKLGDNEVYVGASVRIQYLIKQLGEWGLGGFEYLFSLPALFGGIIVMNAGRGSDGSCISDYIQSIRVLKDGEEIEMSKEMCDFGYRTSIFKNGDYIILGATLKCDFISQTESKKRIHERIKHCRDTQDAAFPCFGSVFSKSSYRLMNFLKKHSPRNKKIRYSSKTVNWIINENKGSYSECIKLINRAKILHKLFFRKCNVEVIIWDK